MPGTRQDTRLVGDGPRRHCPRTFTRRFGGEHHFTVRVLRGKKKWLNFVVAPSNCLEPLRRVVSASPLVFPGIVASPQSPSICR
ncbi:hypothetical protein BaRGS_00031003 [Batillaria attramentaria]|uniref:Uncharacterized protein n=1 Tax=Batillaria attramentaria TaxID=370345 RepID=A0ABD0JDC1_9CAEN